MLKFPLINDTSRKIIHIDMDAFFASVEQRDDPTLRGKPIVIARSPLLTGGRGVVSTASYEARKFGIHSAMSSKEAYELCPQAIFISGHYEHYREVSQQVREIFARYTDQVEYASIDEAYLDVTENKIHSKSAVKIAKLIQYDIYHELHLTCSAGISYNKFLAKIASDYEKPHGLTVILPEEAVDFLKKLPVEKFHGVGKATVPKLHEMGIKNGADLQKADPIDLAQRFGVYGWYLYLRANGIHESPVKPSRDRKSVGKERTYSRFLETEDEIKAELTKLADMVAKSLQAHELKGNIVVLKVRYEDFTSFTKRKVSPDYIDQMNDIYDITESILEELELEDKAIRLLGITVTGFAGAQSDIDMTKEDEE